MGQMGLLLARWDRATARLEAASARIGVYGQRLEVLGPITTAYLAAGAYQAGW